MKTLVLVIMAAQLIYGQLNKHDLVPDILNKYPESILEITYNDNDKVEEGNELTPTQVQNPPQLKWQADVDDFYLLLMIDPDAPSRANPTGREWMHWMVGNIPGNDVSKGEILADYIGSGPPLDSGLHRYIFLLFKQPGKIDFSKRQKFTNTSVYGREKFCNRKFAKEYNLGEPIAANLFQAQFDSYVPELYKKLGVV